MKIQAAGVSTNYQAIGKGPIVVLLHGWGCDWQIWSPLISELSEHFQVLALDLPAFGDSQDPPTVWMSPDYANWLHDVLQQLAPKGVEALVGHSFGGKVAAQFIPTFPTFKVKKLVLIGSAGLPAELSFLQSLQMQVLGYIPDQVKSLLSIETRERLLRHIGSSTDHVHSSAAQRAILRKVVRENIATVLPNISQPTLLIWGENDQETPINQAQQFAALLPVAELHILQNTAHFPFLDQPKEVLKLLRPFLKA